MPVIELDHEPILLTIDTRLVKLKHPILNLKLMTMTTVHLLYSKYMEMRLYKRNAFWF